MSVLKEALQQKRMAHLLGVLVALMVFSSLAVSCQAPEFPDLPGLPQDLSEIPDVLKNLELPDLSEIGIEIPGMDLLPTWSTPAGSINFSGPIEREIKAGERVPGTDYTLVSSGNGVATFEVIGMQSPRGVGDSVDFDGAWPNLAGSQYAARMRIYTIGNNTVRLAGVHQLTIPNIQPVMDSPLPEGFVLRFPFTDGVEIGVGNPGDDVIAGTTLGYLGRYDRGAQIVGLGPNVFPYRSVADSIEWMGTLRNDVGAEYDLRVLNYGRDSMRVGGTVAVTVPAP